MVVKCEFYVGKFMRKIFFILDKIMKKVLKKSLKY